MWGGVLAKSFSRMIPMSRLAGSLQSQEVVEEVAEVAGVETKAGGGGGGVVLAGVLVSTVCTAAVPGTTGDTLFVGADAVVVEAAAVVVAVSGTGTAGATLGLPPAVLESTYTMAKRTHTPTHMGMRSFTRLASRSWSEIDPCGLRFRSSYIIEKIK